RLITLDDRAIISGRSEKAVINVPDGKHQLKLTSDADLLLRLRQMDEDDFLFPGLNKPTAWENGLSGETQSSHAVRQSQLLARENRVRAAGLVAIDRLARQAAITAGNDLDQSMTSLRNRHLFSRPLLPDTPVTGIYSASFSTPRMLYRQETRSGVIARQHINALLKSFKHGFFHPLTSRHDYPLPKRDAVSLLRISVDVSRLDSDHKLSLQMDDLAPIKLTVNHQHRASQALQQIDIQQAALDQFSATTATAFTLNGDVPGRSGRLARVATIEIPLPAEIQQVSLQLLNGPPVAVALHYQDAAPFRLREDELLALLQDAGNERAYQDFISRLESAAVKPLERPLSQAEVNQQLQAAASLANALLPIHQWLDTQQQRFMHQLGDTVIPPGKRLSEIELAHRLAALGEDEAGLNPVTALQRQVLIARHSHGDKRDRALADMAVSLQALGETYLAEHLLKV
ncbi:MAG: hypothetical protein R3311_16385, partial [Oceanisphaera sp.]|nr:hypothetical protein [Oceanisphaera sp.]